MPRGGARKGTPGKAYPERSDLNMDHAAGGITSEGVAPQTAAAGGVEVPPQPVPYSTPEDSPGLLGESLRPNEDVLAGVGMPQQQNMSDDWKIIERRLPDLQNVILHWEDVPQQYKQAVYYFQQKLSGG